KEWDQYVDATLFAYRTKTHKMTGYSPFYLIYGRQATLPVELKIPSGRTENDNVEDILMERLYQIIETLEEDRQEVYHEYKGSNKSRKVDTTKRDFLKN